MKNLKKALTLLYDNLPGSVVHGLCQYPVHSFFKENLVVWTLCECFGSRNFNNFFPHLDKEHTNRAPPRARQGNNDEQTISEKHGKTRETPGKDVLV